MPSDRAMELARKIVELLYVSYYSDTKTRSDDIQDVASLIEAGYGAVEQLAEQDAKILLKFADVKADRDRLAAELQKAQNAAENWKETCQELCDENNRLRSALESIAKIECARFERARLERKKCADLAAWPCGPCQARAAIGASGKETP